MSDQNLTQLAAAAALTGTELIYTVQGGADKVLTPAQLATFLTSSKREAMVSIPNGVESVAIVFATALAALPTKIHLTLLAPAGGAGFMVWADASTLTVNGFTARLGALTPNANYQLCYSAS
jgi:hypothetical protein